jgi:predicted HTH transcriptional regulator
VKILQVYYALDEPKTVYRLSKELSTDHKTVRRNLKVLIELKVVNELGSDPKRYVRSEVKE